MKSIKTITLLSVALLINVSCAMYEPQEAPPEPKHYIIKVTEKDFNPAMRAEIQALNDALYVISMHAREGRIAKKSSLIMTTCGVEVGDILTARQLGNLKDAHKTAYSKCASLVHAYMFKGKGDGRLRTQKIFGTPNPKPFTYITINEYSAAYEYTRYFYTADILKNLQYWKTK